MCSGAPLLAGEMATAPGSSARWSCYLDGSAVASCTGGGVPIRRIGLFSWYRNHAKTPGQLRVKRDLERGYWYDANQLQKNPNAKFWAASPPSLTPELSAPKLPLDQLPAPLRTLKANSQSTATLENTLRSDASPGTLLVISLRRYMSQPSIQAWYDATATHDIPMSELMLVERLNHRLLVRFLLSHYRSKLSVEQQEKFFMHFGLSESFRDSLDLCNEFASFALLVDSSLRIRWKCAGVPTEEDTNNLRKAYGALRRERAAVEKKQQRKMDGGNT